MAGTRIRQTAGMAAAQATDHLGKILTVRLSPPLGEWLPGTQFAGRPFSLSCPNGARPPFHAVIIMKNLLLSIGIAAAVVCAPPAAWVQDKAS